MMELRNIFKIHRIDWLLFSVYVLVALIAGLSVLQKWSLFVLLCGLASLFYGIKLFAFYEDVLNKDGLICDAFHEKICGWAEITSVRTYKYQAITITRVYAKERFIFGLSCASPQYFMFLKTLCGKIKPESCDKQTVDMLQPVMAATVRRQYVLFTSACCALGYFFFIIASILTIRVRF